MGVAARPAGGVDKPVEDRDAWDTEQCRRCVALPLVFKDWHPRQAGDRLGVGLARLVDRRDVGIISAISSLLGSASISAWPPSLRPPALP